MYVDSGMPFVIAFFIFVAIILVFVGILAYVIVRVVRAVRRSRAPVLTSPATVVAKRDEVVGGEYGTSTRYYATFEFPDGNRLELSVPDSATGQLVVGDTGTLYWKNDRFNGFQRETLR